MVRRAVRLEELLGKYDENLAFKVGNYIWSYFNDFGGETIKRKDKNLVEQINTSRWNMLSSIDSSAPIPELTYVMHIKYDSKDESKTKDYTNSYLVVDTYDEDYIDSFLADLKGVVLENAKSQYES